MEYAFLLSSRQKSRGMHIEQAKRGQSADITELIMQAMSEECCLHFARPPKHGLDDFRRMMKRLVERDDSQYSYLNTLVAMDDDCVVGILVSYDGGRLHSLRRAFIEAAREELDADFRNMDDETEAGELYLDSLAVSGEYRRRGIATALLQAGIEKARQMGIGRVGLLVDIGNPTAERLYCAVGFRWYNNSSWGGHAMRHLVFDVEV